jgi:hypothetical protein
MEVPVQEVVVGVVAVVVNFLVVVAVYIFLQGEAVVE